MRTLALIPLIFVLTGCPQKNGGSCAEACVGQIPPAECTDATTLRTYAPAEACTDTCAVTMSERKCDVGCRDGQCVSTSGTGGGTGGSGGGSTGGGTGGTGGTGGGTTSCTGLSCNTPPANVCADASTLRIYEPRARCRTGRRSRTRSATRAPAGGTSSSTRPAGG